jgi:hypothetical protein
MATAGTGTTTGTATMITAGTITATVAAPGIRGTGVGVAESTRC